MRSLQILRRRIGGFSPRPQVRPKSFGAVLAVLASAAVHHAAHGQNLVPNPSFENFTACPNNASQIANAIPWHTPTTGSPDYFHACQTAPNSFGVPSNGFGNETAHSGSGYVGIRVFTPAPHDDYREYIEVQLISPLTAGQQYEVSFYASLADPFKYAIENLDAYLSVGSVGPLTNGVNLPFTPQITNPTGPINNKSGWRLITGIYTATGGEDHLVIGNFRADASTTVQVVSGFCCAYYFIDDVSITKVTPCGPTPDGSGCQGACPGDPNGNCNIFPSQLTYNPTTGETTVTGCACDGCFIRRQDVPPFDFFCFGSQCPDSGQPCDISATTNPDGTILYECCQEARCRPNQDQTACEGPCVSGGVCKPRCLRRNVATGQTLVHECMCQDETGCHAVRGVELPTCEGACPDRQTCIQTRRNFTDPATGASIAEFCCDCEDVCPPQPLAPGDLCIYYQQIGPNCLGGGPGDHCLPRTVDIFGNPALGKLYPLATDCGCGPCGLVAEWGTWPTTGLPYVFALSCGGPCTPPDHGACWLYKNDVPIGSNISVLVSSLDLFDTIKCDCAPAPRRCLPNAAGTACEGTCPSGLCRPTQINCAGHFCSITECDCLSDAECHIDLIPGTTQATCTGRCPAPLGCALMSIEQPGAGVSHSCQCEGAPPCPDEFSENFDAYAAGSICGQGGWEQWIDSDDVCGTVSTQQAFDGSKSVRIVGNVGGSSGLGDDIVHRLNASEGQWTFRVMTFVPHGATGIAYVSLLSTYDDPPGASPNTFRWSAEAHLNANTDFVSPFPAATGQRAPLVHGRWAELRLEIDLDQDSVDYFYDGVQFVSNRSWINGASTGGRPLIQALDLYAGEPNANGTSGMFFDAVSLVRVGADCNHNATADECDLDTQFSLDTNGSGIPDECESWGDFNGDGHTNLDDWQSLRNCLRGPGAGVLEGCAPRNIDGGPDVDLRDYARFQNFFTGL